MAGLSARFTNQGYTLPKYMLFAGNQSLFRIAVSSFSSQFSTAHFVFLYRNIFDTKAFITAECALLSIKNSTLIEVEKPTKGQAETVKIGIDFLLQKGIEDEMMVFNADTAKMSFVLPPFIQDTDGYLEVFEGEGEHWSFVAPLEHHINRVARTTEKVRISNLCSNGLYHFKTMQLFMEAYHKSFNSTVHTGEYYIAPMYNALIEQGKKIHYVVLPQSQMLLFGTPVEYIQFVKSVI